MSRPAGPVRPDSSGTAPVSSILNGEDSESPGRVVSLQEDSIGVLGVDNYREAKRRDNARSSQSER